MDDGRNEVPHTGFEGTDPKHKRAIGVNTVKFEPLCGLLFQHGRREGTERLAEFNSAVQHRLRIATTRVSKNTSVAQCSRSQFRTSLEPSAKLSSTKPLDCFVQQRVRQALPGN